MEPRRDTGDNSGVIKQAPREHCCVRIYERIRDQPSQRQFILWLDITRMCIQKAAITRCNTISPQSSHAVPSKLVQRSRVAIARCGRQFSAIALSSFIVIPSLS